MIKFGQSKPGGLGHIDTADSDLMHHQYRLSVLQWKPGSACRNPANIIAAACGRFHAVILQEASGLVSSSGILLIIGFIDLRFQSSIFLVFEFLQSLEHGNDTFHHIAETQRASHGYFNLSCVNNLPWRLVRLHSFCSLFAISTAS